MKKNYEKMYVMAIRKSQEQPNEFVIETFNTDTKQFKNYKLKFGVAYPGQNKVWYFRTDGEYIVGMLHRDASGWAYDEEQSTESLKVKNEIDRIMYANLMEV